MHNICGTLQLTWARPCHHTRFTDLVIEIVMEEMGSLLCSEERFHVSINIPAGCMESGRFLPRLAAAVSKAGVRPSQVWLEVTERGFMTATAATDAINRTMANLHVPISVHGEFAGTAQVFQASLASEPLLILAAIVAVYIVLGVLYESYIHPITILSTLPSAGVGAVFALLLFKSEFSLIALIGVILLIGIVKKNAIMMIDFALDAQRNGGLNAHDAIYQACMLRFRPIMMTTLAAMLGALPLAIISGDGAELRQPLGISIVGGLLVSQLLTLYTTPVVYLYLERFRERCRTAWLHWYNGLMGDEQVGPSSP